MQGLLEREREHIIKLRIKGKKYFWGHRFLGKINLENNFVTTRNHNHFYIKMNAFCFNQELITELISIGLRRIVLRYKKKYEEEEEIYLTSPKEIREKGTFIREGIFENQIAMPIRLFTEI